MQFTFIFLIDIIKENYKQGNSMKGIIFTSLQEMVEDKFGIQEWDGLLENVELPSHCIYTAGGTYDDAELVELVTKLSARSNIPVPKLIEAYGEYLFPILAIKHPQFISKGMSFKEFLQTIDQVIHVEVHKLYPEAGLPAISYEDSGQPDQLVLLYRSPRKFCSLATGLINGASQHFKTPVTINHTKCMHSGSDHCRLELKFA